MKKIAKIAIIVAMIFSVLNFIPKTVQADFCERPNNDPIQYICPQG